MLTTHYMHEAEVLCDRLAIMNQGKVVAEGTPSDMIQKHTPGYMGIFKAEDNKLIQKIAIEKNFHFHEDISQSYLRAKTLNDLTLLHDSHQLTPLQIRPSNLEDVFLKLTGQELSSDA